MKNAWFSNENSGKADYILDLADDVAVSRAVFYSTLTACTSRSKICCILSTCDHTSSFVLHQRLMSITKTSENYQRTAGLFLFIFLYLEFVCKMFFSIFGEI